MRSYYDVFLNCFARNLMKIGLKNQSKSYQIQFRYIIIFE